MPGVTLEDPFPVAKFHKTLAAEALKRQPIIGLTALDGVADNAEEHTDRVVVTAQGEGIKIYSTIDQKCVKSWTTPPSIVFAGPAVHRLTSGSNDNNYDYTYAIISSGPDIPKEQERRVVWMWKDTREDNSTKDSRIVKTFDKAIYAIHAPSSLRSHVILVNENGSLSLSKVELDRLVFKRAAHGKSCKVIWSTAFSYRHGSASFIPTSLIPGNSTVIVTVCQLTQESNQYTINLHYISKEEDSIQPLVHVDFNSENHLVSFTFDPLKGKISTLGESGSLSIWKLFLTHRTKKTTGRLELQFTRTLQGYQIVSKELGSAAMTARLSKGYVAVIAPRLKKDGDKVEHVLSIWDETYGTLQAERLIEVGGNTGAFRKNECTYALSVLHNSHIAISISSVQQKAIKKGTNTKNVADSKSAVVSCSFFQENVSLLTAMGGMRATAKFLGLQDAQSKETLGIMRCGLDIPCKPNEDNAFTDFDDLISKRKEAENTDAEARQQLLDPELDVEAFTNTLFKIAQFTPDQSVAPQDQSLESAMAFYSEKITFMEEKGSIDHLSSHLIHDITQKCFSDPSFWPEDVVLYLLAKEKLWNRNVPGGVIKQLLERNEWILIRLALAYVPDISELDLVRLIKAVIEAQNAEEQASWKPSLKEYLLVIINSKHAGVFFGQALRRLTPSELPIVLNVVTELVEAGASVSDIDENNFKSVLKFADSLIDGHFPTLIMESGLHKTVAKLRDLLVKEIDTENEIQGALPVLLPFFRKNVTLRKDFAKGQRPELKNKFKIKNQSQGIPPYRIEVIDWGFSV